MKSMFCYRSARDCWPTRLANGVLGCLLLGLSAIVFAQEHPPTPASTPVAAKKPAAAASSAKEIGINVNIDIADDDGSAYYDDKRSPSWLKSPPPPACREIALPRG